jgi:hypothetical protein
MLTLYRREKLPLKQTVVGKNPVWGRLNQYGYNRDPNMKRGNKKPVQNFGPDPEYKT